MFHTCPNLDSAARITAVESTALHIFVQDHLDGLANAASLLAGRRGARLVAELAGELSRGVLGRAALNRAHAILDILSLEHVHDPDREEAARFALIDPTDPVVEDICLLTDGLRRALDGAVPDHPPVLRRRPVA